MRRTYRSKKESGKVLDHREVIQNLDEKASVFDAFYIQNIKQTKRELSCIGSSNHNAPASNKVRKRKYVKRIVKEVENPTNVSESTSTMVFLTPDKSIRVNKAQDLFDQLLNSSSPKQAGLSSDKVVLKSKLQHKVKPNTYRRKNLTKIKKVNCSSGDSFDSDKENSSGSSNGSHNITDIRKHELLIEKERKPSKEDMDDSIKNIFKNISILNNINGHRKSSYSPNSNKSLISNCNNHRLTTNLNLSDLSKSPLCSTPFKEKYRSQSIYKFSPIALHNKGESPKNLSNVEENDNASVIFIDKNNESSHSVENVVPPSPIIHLSVNKSCKSGKIELDVLFSKKDVGVAAEKVVDNNHIEIMSSFEISKFQTTESELFKGFSNIKNNVNEKINMEEHCDKQSNSIKSDQNIDIEKNIYNDNSLNIQENIEDSLPCNSDIVVSSSNMETNCNKTDQDVDIEKEFKDDNRVNDQENIEDGSPCNSDIDVSNINVSSSSQQSEDTSYDTCNSEQSDSSINKASDAKKVPIVKIEKLPDSILIKYINKFHEVESQDECDEIDTDQYASFEDGQSHLGDSNRSTVSDVSVIITDNDAYNDDIVNTDVSKDSFDEAASEELNSNNSIESHIESEKETVGTENLLDDSTILGKFDIQQNVDEEKCLSFVTTRRRNGVGNKSLVLDFNNSISSTSSAECENTVLSNKYDNRDSNDILNCKTDDHEDCYTNKDYNTTNPETMFNQDGRMKNLRISGVTTMTSVRLTRDSNVARCSTMSCNIDSDAESKPPIVLQPGKKWERSLCIYRRMTMMADHFDHSMLDDENLNTKGRKYRQSIISTMELQDHTGSLHNESIHSRRSTFVSKPCRSTIRIVKEPNTSRLSLSSSIVSEDLIGFLTEDCDDTVVELSKLSIADSEHEITVLEQFHGASNRVVTAKDYVLRRCNQTDAIPFDECYPDATLKNCRKIGEGVYGEVFLWRAGDGRVRVMKIVPIAGTIKVNGEHQKDFDEIISEIVIAMELSALRAPIDEIQRAFDEGKNFDALDLHSVENATNVFNEVLAVRCVSGCYPSRLLDLWELYDECKGSENDNPAILPADQQYIVLELANAGQDLESFEFNNAEQAHALFLQVAFGLAVAEEAFQFEHRDLHWGNILIAPTDQKSATFVLRGRLHTVPRRGVSASIIDYSLSRVSLSLGGERAALYNDLAADEGLFDAVGDYQFEVYRRMRDKLGNDWKNFEPYTNVLWLHYTVDKMITALRYKRTNTKIHKHYIAKLKGIKNRILDYGSAAQFVLTDNEF